jgi:hypothetical protein
MFNIKDYFNFFFFFALNSAFIFVEITAEQLSSLEKIKDKG